MSTRITEPGVFRGPILEHTLGKTQKGYPSFNFIVQAAEMFVTDPEVLKSMGVTEPCWAKNPTDETINGFICLFNDPDSFTQDTKLFGLDQVINALGWSGESFSDLKNGSYLNKGVLFSVEPNEYNGKTSLQLQRLDSYEASPLGSLRGVTDDEAKEMDQKLNLGRAASKPKPVTATVVTKPKPIANATPGDPLGVEDTPAPAETPAPAAAAAAPVETPAPTETPAPAPSIQPCTKTEAWEDAYKNNPHNKDDATIAALWAEQVTVLGITDTTATPDDWGKLRNAMIFGLA